MATKYEFDVFISYSHKDEEWVTKSLLPRLEEAGLNVCIDFRDFEAGKAALHNMRNAVKRSARTLLVMTPNWVASEWTLYESILVRTSDPAGLKKRTIPLLLKKCEIPEDISILTYVNLTRADREDLAWRQLLTALGKPPEPEQPKAPQQDDWFLPHPYPMPPNFTGRAAERAMLKGWLNEDAAHPLLSLRALGGFGKSALAWHWLTHDVACTDWPRVVWWSFYEGDASFDHFLAETVNYLSGGKIEQDKRSGKNALNELIELLHQSGTLLVLDGFERVLRAFGDMDAAYQGDEAKLDGGDRECVSPLAELFLYEVVRRPNLRSKVLITTRLCPRVLEAKGGGLLEGCREEELKQMQRADAVEFFRAQGIRGTRTEIETACAPYGYHPLSLRLLAGLVERDFELPGDIAAATHLDVSGDLVARQHHVLEMAYNSLTAARQALLSHVACFRSAVRYEALKALAETAEKSSTTLDADLRDLVARGLLHHDTKEGRFDLHPMVRRYAYDRLAAPDRAAAHSRLRDYFAAMREPEEVTHLEDLAPVIELYHHTVRAGELGEAFTLFRSRLSEATYYQFGAYQLCIDLLLGLFPDGEDRAPGLKVESDQGWTLNDLANSCSLSGQPRRAVALFERQIALGEKQGMKKNVAIGLGNLAYMAQVHIGALRAAEVNLRGSVALCREIGDEWQKAVGHQELARLLVYRGAWRESETELEAALEIKVWRENPQGHGVNWGYRALRELLLLRSSSRSAMRNPHSAIGLACRALELADETARTRYLHERDYVRALWLLGAARRVTGEHDEAERHLQEALQRCRRISLVEFEADILVDLARLRAATGKPDEARRLAEEALVITERSGYVLQGADARIELAKLARGRGDKAAAVEHAREALQLATCDGPPDYTYKAAYEEAGALLRELEGDGTKVATAKSQNVKSRRRGGRRG